MATCMYCGTQIPDGVKFCTSCGAALPVEAAGVSSFTDSVANATVQQPEQPFAAQQPDQAYQQPSFQQPDAQQAYQQPGAQQPYGQAQPVYAQPVQQPVNDSGSIGWGILGFIIPIVGLVLFLVWKNTKPKCAKVAGIGALISVCINIVWMVFGGGMSTYMSMIH